MRLSPWGNQDQNDQAQEMRMFQESMGQQSVEAINDQVLLQQQQERQDLLKWQQDLHDELQDLLMKLRRKQKNADGEWEHQNILIGYDKDGNKVFEELPPYINEVGIAMVENTCKPLLSRNMINTNITEDRGLDMLKFTCNNLATDIAMNYESYDLELNNFSTVVRIIKNTIIPTPFRAVSGWNKKIDSTISKRAEIFNSGGQMQQRKKLFGIF